MRSIDLAAQNTPQSESLNEDVLKVVDLLERKYELHSGNKKSKTEEIIEIQIYLEDLEIFDLRYEVFSQALFQLGKHVPLWNFPLIDQPEEFDERSMQSQNPPESIVDIILPENFRKVVEESRKKFRISRDLTLDEFWITRSNNDYYFNGDKISIKNKQAKYVKIFEIVFSLVPMGGIVKYEDIKKKARQNKPKLDISNKIVQRALTGNDANFFRYVKGIDQSPRGGEAFFVALQNGKELEFKNKK